MKQDETTDLDLQAAVERFLEDVQNRRPDSVAKRYSTALDLLLTYLALELIDPDTENDASEESAIDISSLTPKLLRRYVTDFLTARLGPSDKALSKHVAAVKSFLRFLAGHGLIPPNRASALAEVLEESRNDLAPADKDRDSELPPRLFRLISFDDDPALFQDLVTAKPLRASLSNPHSLDLDEDRVYLVSVSKGIQGPVATLLGLLDSPLTHLAEDMSHGQMSKNDEGGIQSDWDDEEGDWWDDDSDMALMDDEAMDSDFFSLTPEEAIEILAFEDRFAPRQLVEAVFDYYTEVREQLLDWIHDDHLRSVPLPGLGEAPANAARILSEMGEMEIASRLITILGHSDPLGEEAPAALARLGPEVLPALEKVLKERRLNSDRRIAALWAMGYMAARHPTVRAKVVGIFLNEILKTRPEAQTALGILAELRATEALPKLRKAERSGKLDLESLGYTMELFEDQVSSPAWGEIVGGILVPVVFLYPTEEQIDDLYESVGGEIDDFLDDWDEDDPPKTWKAPGTSDNLPRSQGKSGPAKGNVIPFRPINPDEEKE